MKWAALLLVVFVGSDTALYAADNLSLAGIVEDSRTHAVVTGAKVVAIGGLAAHDVITGESGIFILSLVPDATMGMLIPLRVEKAGYQVYEDNFPVSAKPIHIFLVPSSHAARASSIGPAIITKADRERREVFQNLSGIVRLPADGDARRSMFTVSNKGPTAILEHQIWCRVNAYIAGPTLWIERSAASLVNDKPTTIGAGGDADSQACLTPLSRLPLGCADISLIVEYNLVTQPKIAQVKGFRFVTRQEGSSFAWYQKPIATEDSYCFDQNFDGGKNLPPQQALGPKEPDTAAPESGSKITPEQQQSILSTSVATELKRGKPVIKFSVGTTGDKNQRMPVSVLPEVIEMEPKSTIVKGEELPKAVPVEAGTVTVLKFGKDDSGGYILFDTSRVPKETTIHGEISEYTDINKPPR